MKFGLFGSAQAQRGGVDVDRAAVALHLKVLEIWNGKAPADGSRGFCFLYALLAAPCLTASLPYCFSKLSEAELMQ